LLGALWTRFIITFKEGVATAIVPTVAADDEESNSDDHAD